MNRISRADLPLAAIFAAHYARPEPALVPVDRLDLADGVSRDEHAYQAIAAGAGAGRCPRRSFHASLCRCIGRAWGGREDAVETERIVALFRNGRNQAVRIPRDLELPGHEALLRKEGNRLIVEPVRKPNLLELAASWEPLDEEFDINEDDLPPLRDVDL